jgi:adenosylmethionine-8-amino-7-oxononanoate aminotransferase
MPSAIFHRSLDKCYPVAVKGQGVYLVTESGDKILDGCCGAAVSCLGHSNQEVIEAIVDQTRSLSFAHTSAFTSDAAESLAQLLLQESSGAFSRVNFLTSGSEAVETSLKIARQYHVYNGEPGRVNIIGRDFGYHGNTLGALAAGNNPARRDTFAPMLGSTFHHVSRCFYDADGKGKTERDYENSLIAELKTKISDLGAETVAAVIIETVGGATLGSVPPTQTYLARIKSLCDQHGILFILDEIMCGMGRQGTLHAWQAFGNVAPHLQTIGKGLGAGYQPLSAVLLSENVTAVFEAHSKGPKKFVSGHTFQGHSAACAGALMVQNIVKRQNLLENVTAMGVLLRSKLRNEMPALLLDSGASIRGSGLFFTVDFGNANLTLGGELAGDVQAEAFKNGAAVYCCSTAVDAILFAPPFIISEEEVEELAGIFIRSLNNVIGRRQSAGKVDNGRVDGSH